MIASHGLVVQNMRRAAVGAGDRIDAAVIVDVSNGHAPPYPGLLEYIAGSRRYIDKLAADVAQEYHRLAVVQLRRLLLDIVHIVALRDEQILPAIVVIIEKTKAPARV